ncbi:MAG TPA: DnaB-like helicase C-terminal domain-containing protein [Bacillota bacterium]|nr:DnaB-like helicase C-terminal domain-containing protein [Bacillota bacterium]
MEMLPNTKRKKTEVDILFAIANRVEFLDMFDFSDEDFFYAENKLVFKKILELRTDKDTIPLDSILASLSDQYSVLPYIEAMANNVGIAGHSPKTFVELCKVLREDTRKFQLKRMLSQSNSSEDFLENLTRLLPEPVQNFQTFEQQEAAYFDLVRQRIEKRYQGKIIGVETGWKHFDDKVAMGPGDYVVIGARTSIGKTSFALNVAMEAAALRQKVLFISLEMTEDSIFDKIASRFSKSKIWEFAKGHVNESIIAEVQREMSVIRENMKFMYLPNCTSAQVSHFVKKQDHVDLVVVDYLQLLRDTSGKGETENIRLGRISGNLKTLAGEQKCVMLVPAQLNRESEKNKREPYLSDLRDSGCIEQDADKVLLLHRQDRQSVNAKLILAKNRTGATGEIFFDFDPERSFFEECKDQDLQNREKENDEQDVLDF